MQTEDVSIDEWLARIVSEEAEKLPSAVTIECEFGLEGIDADIDAARLSRVFVNLISNASEAMVGKGDDPAKFTTASPRITVTTRVNASAVWK